MQQKKSASIIKRGMRKDVSISQLKPEDYILAVNANTNNETGEGFNIQNEPSNYFAVLFPEGYKVIHNKVDTLTNRTYYYLTNPTTRKSSIGYVDQNFTNQNNQDVVAECDDCTQYNELGTPLEEVTQIPYQEYVEILNDDCLVDDGQLGLNFDVNFPIEFSELQYLLGDTYHFFNDYRNPPRYLNLTSQDYLFIQEEPCSNPTIQSCPDLDRLLVFPKHSRIQIEPEVVQVGGDLKLGTYEIFGAYCDEFGNELTEYSTPTNPISIFDENNYILSQPELDSKTNFAIKLKVNNLDNRFKYYKIVVAERTNVNNTQSYFVEGIHPTTDDTVIYSTNSSKERISAEVLYATKIQVERAKGVTESDNTLIHFGIERKREINLQPVVNLMGGFLKWQSSVAKEDLFKSPIATSKYKGFPRLEVKPFSIRFNFKDGGSTPIFPFIARPALDSDLEEIDAEDLNRMSIEAYTTDCSPTDRTKRWQFFDTAFEEDKCFDITEDALEVIEQETKTCEINPVETISAGTTTFEIEDEFIDLRTFIEQNPDVSIPEITPYLTNDYPDDHCAPNFGTVFTSGELVIGKTYIINEVLGSDDFSNTGFSEVGVPFEAEVTTPNVWSSSTEVVETTCNSPELVTEENLLGNIVNEVVTKEEKVFPDDYSKLKKPNYCFIYKIGTDGKYERNVDFEKEFMPTDTIFPDVTWLKAYTRDFNFANDDCAYADNIVNLNNGNTTLVGYFHDYLGANTVAELQTAKEVLDVTTEFTDKLHRGALWFKGETLQREKFLLEVSKQSDAAGNDDIIRGGKNSDQEVRLNIFDKCGASTALYSKIYKTTDGIQLLIYDITDSGFKIDDGINPVVTVTSPLTADFFVAIDNAIVSENALTDPEDPGAGTTTKYRTAPTDGCFSIALRNIEYSSVTVSWDSIDIIKRETYVAACRNYIPKVDDCEPKAFAKGTFAYWESLREYPNNSELYNSSTLIIPQNDIPTSIRDTFEQYYVDIVDTNYVLKAETDFRCKPIRHYKFPSNVVSPFMMDLPLPSFADSYVFPLGVSLDNEVVIAFLDIAVKNNLITQDERDSIESYEILTGDSTLNKSVVANGLAYDMFKYTEKEKNIYYANFPHNDLGEDKLHFSDSSRSEFIAHPFDGDGNNKYSFVSPDLLLNKVTTPNEIVFSGYQIGNSKTNFSEVDNHPKWTILGQRAKNLALTLAIAEVTLETVIKVAELTANQWFVGGTSTGASLGGVGAGIASAGYAVQAFMKVGQYRYQWLKTFRDLGAMRNFSSYGVSEGIHNRFLTNQDEAMYLRALSTKKDLKDSRKYSIRDEKTGEDIVVNSFLREYSTFLSLGEYNINYSNEYRYHDNSSLNKNFASRTIASDNDCDDTEFIRNVGSPYFTLKNYLPEQYGDIDSIKWLTTNYTNKLDNNSECQTIFGGTHVISRFTYKRKIPFFSKTSFNLPDKTPFNYYDYKNVAYPRFYVNYEEDGDYPIIGIPFPDIDSSYNFDCRNTSNRMYIGRPNKFYLWYYGITSFLVESEINCNFRYAGKTPREQFYPLTGDVVEWTQEKTVSIKEPNVFNYNNVYSLPVSNSPYRFLDRNYSAEEYDRRRKNDNALIISERDNSNGNITTNPWLSYKPLSYFELPIKAGKLSFLDTLGSQQLLAVFEDQISVYNAIDSLQKGLDNSITEVGRVGNIFQARPLDFLGKGSELSESLSTPFGYFIIDEKRGSIYRYLGGGNLETISEVFNGQPTDMKQWFKEHIPFKLKKQLPMIDFDNKYKGIGFNMWFDERNSRVFITKRDYVLTTGTQANLFSFNPETKQLFYDEEEVYFDDDKYFKNVSWTISFKPLENGWNSFFTFYPDFCSSLSDTFTIGYNWGQFKETVWEHTLGNSSFQVFQGELNPFTVEYPIANENVQKYLSSVSINLEARRYQNNWDFSLHKDVGFNKMAIWTNTKHSGNLNLFAQKKLSDNRNYPKTNPDNTQDILFTAVDGHHNVNYFWNRVLNQQNNIPMWRRDENNIFKTVDPRAVNFIGKRINERLTGDTFVVSLTNDLESRFNIILKNTINKEIAFE